VDFGNDGLTPPVTLNDVKNAEHSSIAACSYSELI
jgi:hypothetical protein